MDILARFYIHLFPRIPVTDALWPYRIYNSVHLSRYHQDIKPLYNTGKDEIVLGCAGRLSEEKGHLFLLEMMHYLLANGNRFRLLIAGEGRLLHSLQKKVRKLGIGKQVEFLGFVEDMPAFFRSLDIFLLSSHYEGFGYVIAEAMASRKPVVAFDIKSSAEIIQHGVTGYITERNNARSNKQWGEADRIRSELETMHVVLEDRPEGTVWKLKSSI